MLQENTKSQGTSTENGSCMFGESKNTIAKVKIRNSNNANTTNHKEKIFFMFGLIYFSTGDELF